jgi:hypothetical protein
VTGQASTSTDWKNAHPAGQLGVQHGGAAQVGHAQLQAALGVPGHVGAQPVAVLAQQRPEGGREPEGPAGPEHLVGAGEVRCRVDHLAAQAGEHLPGRRQHLPYRRLDRQAEVGAPRDPDAPQVPGQQACDLIGLDARGGRVQGQRHPGVGTGQHGQ